jgi:hypothetical protein
MRTFFTIDLNVDLVEPLVSSKFATSETIILNSKFYDFSGSELDPSFVADVNANVEILHNSLKTFDDSVVKRKIVTDGSELFDDGEQCKIILIRQHDLEMVGDDLDEMLEYAMIIVSTWQTTD